MSFLIVRVDDGTMLASFDPEFTVIGNPTTGLAGWTDNPDDAMKFESFVAAVECWRTQSVTRPFRPDGKPNRPLTAHTVTVIPA